MVFIQNIITPGLPFDPRIYDLGHQSLLPIQQKILEVWKKVRLPDTDLRFNPRDNHDHRLMLFAGMAHAVKLKAQHKDVSYGNAILAAAFIVLCLLLENRPNLNSWKESFTYFRNNAKRDRTKPNIQYRTTTKNIIEFRLATYGRVRGGGYEDERWHPSNIFHPDMWSEDLSTLELRRSFLKNYFRLEQQEYNNFKGF